MKHTSNSELAKQISILGCGWLGLPLATEMIANEFKIKGSTTSENKITTLKAAGIEPYMLSLMANKVDGKVVDFLDNSSILIINIPPKLRVASSENFVQKIEKMIPYIEKSTVEKVIFVSSISVYADNNQTVTERTIPNPETKSGKQLWEVEKLLQANKNFKTTIVRFGGLIGDERHPIYSLSEKKDIKNPDAPINLIHQKDCIKIILEIINNQNWNEIYNGVANFHPTKKEYYTQKAIVLNLEIPEFDTSKPSVGKVVLSEKFSQIPFRE